MDENGPLRYTEAEAAMIGRLAQARVRADAGDRRAKQQIAKVARQVAALARLAKRGNVRAARAEQVLRESGLLVSSQTFAMDGASPWTWKLGGINALNAALLATTGVLLWKRRWGLALAPAGLLVAHEGRAKRWW